MLFALGRKRDVTHYRAVTGAVTDAAPPIL